MNEKIENELKKSAGLIEMAFEDVVSKWNKIVEDNSLNTEDEADVKLGLTLYRSWHQEILKNMLVINCKQNLCVTEMPHIMLVNLPTLNRWKMVITRLARFLKMN